MIDIEVLENLGYGQGFCYGIALSCFKSLHTANDAYFRSPLGTLAQGIRHLRRLNYQIGYYHIKPIPPADIDLLETAASSATTRLQRDGVITIDGKYAKSIQTEVLRLKVVYELHKVQ